MAFRQVILVDGKGRPLIGVDIEAYRPADGAIVQVSRTDLGGRATFFTTSSLGPINFRPRLAEQVYDIIVLDQGDSERIIKGEDGVATTESADPVPDPGLQFPFKQDEVWEFELWCRLSLPEHDSNAGDSCDWIYRLDTGGLVMGEYAATLYSAGGSSAKLVTAYDTNETVSISGALTGTFVARGVFEATADGTFQLYWSHDNADSGDAKLLANSWLIARRLR